MPAVTEKQRRFMAICAHDPEKAQGKCPSKKVAQEFSHKPKGGYGKKKHRYPRRDSNGYYTVLVLLLPVFRLLF